VHPHTQATSMLFACTTTASRRSATIEQPAKAVVDGLRDPRPAGPTDKLLRRTVKPPTDEEE
jgi:hypothetical protein